MNPKLVAVWSGLCAALFFGSFACGEAVVDGEAGVAASSDELKGGCRWDCPKCPPNKVCALAPCTYVCPNDRSPCGEATCGAGLVCCNESCGICTQPGEVCTQQYCGEVEPAATECSTDADCRTFSDYCTGCDCRALGTGEADPVCEGPGVRCFADPCLNQTAVCVNGACELGGTVTF